MSPSLGGLPKAQMAIIASVLADKITQNKREEMT